MKIGLEFCARHVHSTQILQTFSGWVKPQTDNFLVLDERLHIEYMYHLQKLCMFPVRLVDICRFLWGDANGTSESWSQSHQLITLTLARVC